MSSSYSAKKYVYRGGYYDHCNDWEGKGDEPPEDVTNVTFHPNVTSIGKKAFQYSTSLVKIIIPPTVTSISDYAFFDCELLSDVTLPSTLTSIGKYAFNRCPSLKSITLPSSITTIGDYAFYRCTALKSVLVPISSDDSYHNLLSLIDTISCHDLFIELAIKLHPQQIKGVDKNGNLPLHIAALTLNTLKYQTMMETFLSIFEAAANVSLKELVSC
mmetsp:Transcript_22491/g.32866  ORF Transcript_22491/g.32866 Transcript_22491/m.32866 type:complete len:216 (+) Transcript_22491:127-774(+)